MERRLGTLLALALLACVPQPPGTGADGGGDPGAQCKEGATKSCACLGGSSSGQKTCGADGKFGDCMPCKMGAVDPTAGSKPGDSNPAPTSSKCGNCTGCCDGSTCVELSKETDKLCGTKGKSCSPCATGTTCDTASGKCSKPAQPGVSCGSSCDGCCSPTDGCIGYQDTDSFACGVSGSACQACPVVGGLCDEAGMCSNQIAYYEYYQISIRFIDASGVACATQAGAEYNSDPMVCLVAWDTANNKILKDFDGNDIVGCSTYCTSMSTCTRSVADGVVTRALSDGKHVPVWFPGDAINNTNGVIYAYVYDYDPSTTFGVPNSSDLLGQGNLPAVTTLSPGTQISAGPYSLAGVPCNVPVKFEVSYDFSQ